VKSKNGKVFVHSSSREKMSLLRLTCDVQNQSRELEAKARERASWDATPQWIEPVEHLFWHVNEFGMGDDGVATATLKTFPPTPADLNEAVATIFATGQKNRRRSAF
jgi:hypothetical protein